MNDQVDGAEPPPHVPVQAQQHRAAAGKAHARGRHLDRTRAAAVHQADAAAPHHHHPLTGQVDAGQAVVVALHGHHGGDLPQLVEHRQAGDVACVEDEVAAGERHRDRRRELRQHLPHMRVGDHADADCAAQMAMAW